ncbi:dihydroorotase [Paraperlucidibaca baekdonensis]|uniref:Dihydroorotase n=1 Tax=Paraperlucidibaca baekdonensis TaxID=748120 RepID=A0A3E0H901_9GAMM|nr:dihydroorotase [Paraperlucidibaca baekdonensis]REH40188.1 dihydroorotase [Paraperlucidibaca baekdonensis]
MSVIYRGIRVIDPAQGIDTVTDARLHEGQAVALGEACVVSAGDEILDGKGLWLTPAFVDLCARLREPGPKQHGTIASETRAARAGGFGHLVLPPDTNPVIDHGALAAQVIEKAQAAGFAKVYPLGAMTRGLEGKALAGMGGLKAAGCVGVSQARKPLASVETLLRCLEYASSMDMTVFFSPEEASLALGSAHDGFMASRMGLLGIPDSAETVALATTLLLVEQTGVRAHIGQLSCAASVELIRIAKAKGLPVTADVSMHQLHLTEMAIDGFNAMAHVRPPLRRESDRLALIAGVREGVIDAICSDHQPLNASAKLAPFAEALPGMSTLETVLPLGLRLVASGELDASRLIEALTCVPARIIAQPIGSLLHAGGAMVIDPSVSWQVGDAHWQSVGRNSLFAGQALLGRVIASA